MSTEAAEAGERSARSRRLSALLLAVRGFGAERLLLRSAALTYLSIVSMVPLIAVVLSALEALQLVDFQEPIRAFVFENLAVGARENVGAALEQVIDNASAGAEGGIGAVFLLVSAVLLLRNVERAFDDLWGIRIPRSLAQALPRYLGLLLAGPVVLGISLAATAAVRAWAELVDLPFEARLLSLIPLGLSAAGLFALYKFAPAAKVRWKPALFSALLAAAAWEAAKLLFGLYAAYTLRKDQLYGPLVAIPIFLVWIYVTWLIVLFGARLAYLIQHPPGARLISDDEMRARAVETGAARLAVALARAQLEQRPPATAHQVATELRVPEGTVRSLVPILESAGLVVVEKRRLSLAHPADRLTLGTVLRAVRRPLAPAAPGADPGLRGLLGLLDGADEAAAASLDDRLLSDLARSPDDTVGVPLAKA